MGKKSETKLCNECDEVKNVDEFYKSYTKCKPCVSAHRRKIRDARKQNEMRLVSEAVRSESDDSSKDEIQYAYKKQEKRVKKLEKTVAELSDTVDVQRRKMREIEEMIKGFVFGMKLERDLDNADVTELST
jgi:wobble nucleotide-excising tRNase